MFKCFLNALNAIESEGLYSLLTRFALQVCFYDNCFFTSFG